ncbi:helix-turn-helix domain-containing protein [Sphingomonas sp. BGYR3]|uniref:helix-turn-helix domain-containing protein n=1 Tax=Sphingomonas sp. BGYR3 TaxID=2975483 RepID=UPI0021A658AF|nr:helix-turn-helix domain-containing protein [Sphingomonas sp. BGYR3]MDG5489690.1 helix-turn-helix domain-containing protein [Sphingomonas sp. BGYR3]
MADPPVIPSFYLYGEPPRAVEAAFVHCESLDDRSRPSEWTIAPHRHDGLAHIMLIAHGDGTAIIEGERHPFRAPVLVIVPSSVIHGFEWAQESRGHVVTVAMEQIDALGLFSPQASALFGRWSLHPVAAERLPVIEGWIAELSRNLNWDSPGRALAVTGILLALIAEAMRHAQPPATAIRVSRAMSIVARYRDRIERDFRRRLTVAEHAAMLGVSVSTLRAACMAVAGDSPLRIQDERTVLEARRLLRYSNLSVAEIGYALGFADPAHFSRFFKRMAGVAPFRARQ